MRTERELLVDCLGRLNRLGMPYMLVGSMASNYWGIPRTTHDLDFVLAMERQDVERFATVFEDGFFLQRASIRSAFQAPRQFNLLDDSSALKVDFWLLGGDVFERAAFDRRLQVMLFQTPTWIATAEDVILHKLVWNRVTPSDRQLADAAGVFAVQGGVLDLGYVAQWAARLGVEEQLDDLIAGRIRPKDS